MSLGGLRLRRWWTWFLVGRCAAFPEWPSWSGPASQIFWRLVTRLGQLWRQKSAASPLGDISCGWVFFFLLLRLPCCSPELALSMCGFILDPQRWAGSRRDAKSARSGSPLKVPSPRFRHQNMWRKGWAAETPPDYAFNGTELMTMIVGHEGVVPVLIPQHRAWKLVLRTTPWSWLGKPTGWSGAAIKCAKYQKNPVYINQMETTVEA